MPHQDRLHDLIRSMTGPEKGHFKRYAYKAERKSQRYLVLFDALDHQRRYDEKGLLLALTEEAESVQLPAIKQHLYRMLLRTLLEYHSSKDPVDRMLQYIREARLLLKRGMTGAAKDKWKQACRHLERYDLQEYRMVLFEVEAGIFRYAFSERDKLSEMIDGQRKGLVLLQESFEYRARFSRYIATALEHGFSMVHRTDGCSAFSALLAEIQDVDPPHSGHGFQAAYSHWMSITGIHQALGHMEAMLEAGSRLLAAFDAKPHFKAFKSKYYLQALNNRLNQLLLARSLKAFDALVPEVREAIQAAPSPSERDDRLAFLENRILSRMLLEGSSKRLEVAKTNLEAYLNRFAQQPGLRLEAQWNILLAYWMQGHLDTLLEHVELFRNGMESGYRKHYALHVQCLYLLAQWERGEEQHVRMSMDNLRQLGRRQEEFGEAWKGLLFWLERLVDPYEGAANELQLAFDAFVQAKKADPVAHGNPFLNVLVTVCRSRY